MQNLAPREMRFKGIRKYNSATSLPRRPCVFVWGYACFFAALLFVVLARTRQVVKPKSESGVSQIGRKFRRLPTIEPPLHENCEGRRVYMYDLPPEYSTLVQNPDRCDHRLIPWIDLCPRFRNGGFGADLPTSAELKMRPAVDSELDDSDWYETDFYMLEVIFHSRMKIYRCLTTDSSIADAFYLPHYTGLLALDYLYKDANGGRSYEERRLFGKDLIDWLEENGGEAWRRHGGKDHFLVMGRTTWDFKLKENWSTGFSALPHVANMTSLLIESKPGLSSEQAIPYPTAFHPASPLRLQSWIKRVRSANRRYLFAYVGAPRADSSVRSIMSSSCMAAGKAVCSLVDCSAISCSHGPLVAYKSFLQSNFCLQPRGDTSTRRSTFDCLISGAIPVFFHRDTAYTQYTWHLPRDSKSYSVFVDEEDLKRGVSIEHVLRSYSEETIEHMRETIVAMIPSLLYFDCRKDGCSSMNQMDAFDLTMQRLLERIREGIEATKIQFNES